MIADSHCHLDYKNLYNELDEVVERALLNKVKYLLTICTTLKSFDKIKLITNKYKNIYGTFGIHPHETENNHVSKTTIIESINKKLTVVEKIKKFRLIDDNFTIENGLLTPTMKIKRNKVTLKYKNT